MATPDKSFALIEQIQKHPYLYDYTMPEYSRKDLLDLAWHNVADALNSTVTECKEKWRNIRSCFLRDLKTLKNGKKSKRPYYLRNYLQFLVPFLKSAPSPTNDDESSPNEDDDDADDDDERYIIITDDIPRKQSTRTRTVRKRPNEKTEFDENDEIKHNNKVRTVKPTDRSVHKPVLDKTYADYLKLKRQYVSDTPNNPMHHFMLSLLPEFDTMTDQQIRHFKIEVMLLIDKIKSSQESSDDDHLEATSSKYVKCEDS